MNVSFYVPRWALFLFATVLIALSIALFIRAGMMIAELLR